MSSRSNCIRGTWLTIILLAAGFTTNGCFKRKSHKVRHDRLEEKSKTPECKKELLAALDNLRATLGLGFKPKASDTKFLFDKGYVRKGYARDGARFSVSFGLTIKGGKCHLRMFRRTRSRPGEHSTRTGNFGAVELKTCTCK